ncbi:MAG: hypothetical protein QOH64_2763 [Acidimicrobiaceae bacterium]|jgi:hypothetical protein
MKWGVRRNRDGSFRVNLADHERELLGGLVQQLRELLVAEENDGLERLFPPAHPNDEARNDEYRALVHDELLERRLATIDVVEATVDATQLDESQLTAWMGAINDLRLVLGTRLDVSEEMEAIDPDDPRAPGFAVYGYLSQLLGSIVQALADW